MCHHFMGSAGSFNRTLSLSDELIFLGVTAAASFAPYPLVTELSGLDYALIAFERFSPSYAEHVVGVYSSAARGRLYLADTLSEDSQKFTDEYRYS